MDAQPAGPSNTTDQPLVWHYGLMAERWGEFLTDAPELPFFLAEIERFGQPVLDLACGAGRLLVPLLVAGIDIDGCDISQDMLDQCRRRATAAGFDPGLSAQPMDRFELTRRYRTIYICDSFGLAGSRAADLAALLRCREHLGRFRTIALDPLEQTYTREVQLEKWRDGALVASETYLLRGSMYLKSEVMLMLQVAGFADVTVRGDYTGDPATPEHDKLVFSAIRRESVARPAGLEPTTFRPAI